MTDITARVVTTFPALVQGDGGVTIDKSAGVYTIGFDFNVFWSVTGDMLARNADGNPQAVSTGDVGTVLTSTGIGALPEYVAIGAPQIPPGSIGTLELADESVTTPKIAPEAVTAAKMAPDSVGTSALIDANVTNPKLGLLSVATGNIQALAVTDAKLAANAVTAAKLADNSVDTLAIIDLNVTEGKLAANSVTESKIAVNAVTETKIADKAVSLTKMADGTTWGELYYIGSALVPTLLAPGTSGQVLTTQGPGADPTFETPGGGGLGVGAILQSVVNEVTAFSTITSNIPFDDTIPQSNQGAQINQAVITPSATSSKIRIMYRVDCATALAEQITAAAFQDAIAGAVVSGYIFISTAGAPGEIVIQKDISPATTSPVTVSIRVGGATGDAYINGIAAGRRMGGTATAVLTLQEIKG